MINAFTIDFEDWYQGCEIYKVDSWHKFKTRIDHYCDQLLQLLDKHNTKATFFVLGYVAEKQPRLVEIIHKAGHEIGSHGYGHNQVYKLKPEEFNEEIVRTNDAIMSITGKHPIGFRAPIFSIIDGSYWAFDILLDNGYKYDSSMFPILNYRHGFVKSDRFRHMISADSGRQIDELPVTTGRLLGVNLPVGGGAYFRVWPYAVTKWGFKQVNKMKQPGIFYIHPWEIDSDPPKTKMPLRIHLTHYHRLGSTLKKLDKLLSDFEFSSVADVFGFDY
ncbi:MAG: XrtA system polysaccharide deacetylase [candidate division Zixibacteria bacterium]